MEKEMEDNGRSFEILNYVNTNQTTSSKEKNLDSNNMTSSDNSILSFLRKIQEQNKSLESKIVKQNEFIQTKLKENTNLIISQQEKISQLQNQVNKLLEVVQSKTPIKVFENVSILKFKFFVFVLF
jgi:hypothetical protein